MYRTITFELNDLWPTYLACWFISILQVKFEGQGRRSKFTVTRGNVVNVARATSNEGFLVYMYCQQRTLEECCVLTNTRIRSVIFQSYSFHLYWYLLVGHFQFLCRRLQSSDVCSVKPSLHDTTCCQPVVKLVWQPAVSCIQPVVKPVVQPGLTTGWTNSGCSFNRLQPVWQPVVSCKRGISVRRWLQGNDVCPRATSIISRRLSSELRDEILEHAAIRRPRTMHVQHIRGQQHRVMRRCWNDNVSIYDSEARHLSTCGIFELE